MPKDYTNNNVSLPVVCVSTSSIPISLGRTKNRISKKMIKMKEKYEEQDVLGFFLPGLVWDQKKELPQRSLLSSVKTKSKP